MPEITSFSIIIPTYNRPSELQRCLEAVSKLSYPMDKLEVIIVNDGGKMEDEFFLRFNKYFDLKLLNQKNSGPASARNFGAQIAKNDYLAFTDDDCEPDKNWLKNFAEHFYLTPTYLLSGKTINALESNIFSASSQMLIDYLYEYAAEFNSKLTFFTSNNLAIARKEFFKIGGFDKSFPLAAAEDRDFCSRWRESKNESLLVESVIVSHHHHLDWKSFCNQHFNYGRGAFYFHKRRAERLDKNFKIEPPKFYLKMFLFPFRQVSIEKAFRISALFFVGQCANTFGFLRESLNYKKSFFIKKNKGQGLIY